jgi:COPI associated protein
LGVEEEMMAANAGVASANTQQQLSIESGKKDAEHQLVTTTWLLRICKFLNVVTGLAAIVGIITNLSVLSVPSPAPDVALRLYGVLLCVLSVLTELEWTRLFSWLAVLETWIGRGLNNILCGVLILVFENASGSTSSGDGNTEDGAAKTWLLRQVAGNFLLVMGFIYLVSGILCLQRIKNQHLTKIRKRDQALMQKQELETRKHEIELLLRDTESQLEKI